MATAEPPAAPASPPLGPEGERCASCGDELRPDQRYCLSCGVRRAAPRLAFSQVVGAGDAGPSRPATGGGRSERPERSALVPLAALIALLLALGIGVLIGRGARVATVPATQPAVVTVALPAPAAATAPAIGTATTPAPATTTVPDAGSTTSAPPPPGAPAAGDARSTEEARKRSNALPSEVGTEGAPPPPDDEAPGGGTDDESAEIG